MKHDLQDRYGNKCEGYLFDDETGVMYNKQGFPIRAQKDSDGKIGWVTGSVFTTVESLLVDVIGTGSYNPQSSTSPFRGLKIVDETLMFAIDRKGDRVYPTVNDVGAVGFWYALGAQTVFFGLKHFFGR